MRYPPNLIHYGNNSNRAISHSFFAFNGVVLIFSPDFKSYEVISPKTFSFCMSNPLIRKKLIEH